MGALCCRGPRFLTGGESHRTFTQGYCEGKSYPTGVLEFFCADGQKDKVEPADLIQLFKKPLVDFHIKDF